MSTSASPLAAFAALAGATLVTLGRAQGLPLRERAAAAAEALARVYAEGLRLAPVEPMDGPPEVHVLPLRRVLQAAFGEVDAYAAVFDPYAGTVDADQPAATPAAQPAGTPAAAPEPQAPAAEADACSLVDDLVAVCDALSEGLGLFEAGHAQAAQFEWRFALRGHAGRRLTSALYALQTLLSLHLEQDDEDEEGEEPGEPGRPEAPGAADGGDALVQD